MRHESAAVTRRRSDLLPATVRVRAYASGLPARLGDDHLRADVMEALPQVCALQLHLDLLHGSRRRRLAGAGGQFVR